MAKHLQQLERVKIEALLENGKSVDEIAIYLGRHRSTIYREVKRPGAYLSDYNALSYHDIARGNMARIIVKSPSSSVVNLIEEKILCYQWSPEQISNWLFLHQGISVSHTWIYQHIKKDKENGGELFNHLRIGNYSKGHKPYKGKIRDRVSIEEREELVNLRERLGDYEADLIVGAKNKGFILSIVDRKSRYCLLKKLMSKTSSEVSSAIIDTLKFAPSNIYTITTDNGSEFSDHKNISKKLEIKYYFAHPYASYERGSVENLNGLIRQYIPKGSEINDITDSMLETIQEKLNNRPRKVLGFLTPMEYNECQKCRN